MRIYEVYNTSNTLHIVSADLEAVYDRMARLWKCNFFKQVNFEDRATGEWVQDVTLELVKNECEKYNGFVFEVRTVDIENHIRVDTFKIFAIETDEFDKNTLGIESWDVEHYPDNALTIKVYQKAGIDRIYHINGSLTTVKKAGNNLLHIVSQVNLSPAFMWNIAELILGEPYNFRLVYDWNNVIVTREGAEDDTQGMD